MRALLLVLLALTLVSAGPAPIIIVPGLSASALETRYHKQTVPHWLCKKTVSSWSHIWMNVDELLPEIRDCFDDTLEPIYHIDENRFTNKPGVEMRVIDFGGINGVYSLDPPVHQTKIYGHFIDYLKQHGWVVGQTIFGAPYDWRIATPDTSATNGQFAALKELVETAVAKAGRPAHLIGHSMGSPFIHAFLVSYVDQAWKDQHVASFISMGGPFGGAVDAVIYPLSGETWRIPLSPIYLRNMTRTFGAMSWMMPLPGVFQDLPIVSTPTRNYTAGDLPSLFAEVGLTVQSALVTRAQSFLGKYLLTPPGVATHLVVATNYTTPLGYTFAGGLDVNKQPTLTATSMGDGTVPVLSSSFYKSWATQPQPIETHVVGSDHVGMATDPAVYDLVAKIAA